MDASPGMLATIPRGLESPSLEPRGAVSSIEKPLRCSIPSAAAAAANSSSSKTRRQRSVVAEAKTDVNVPRFKLLVLGDYAVGKTSLIRQLTQRCFSHVTSTTIGVEFQEYTVREEGRGSSGRSKAMLQLWDVAGQQYSSSMTRQYYRWAAGAVVCADVTRRSTLDAAVEWRHDVREKMGVPVAPRSCATATSVSSSPTSFITPSSSSSPSPQQQQHQQRAALATIEERNCSVTEDAGGENAGDTSPPPRQPPPSLVPATATVTTTASGASPPSPAEKVTLHHAGEEPGIPIFLVATKADLLPQAETTVQEIYDFARDHGFEDVLITSATDYNSVRDTFEHVTDVVLEHHKRLCEVPCGLCNGSHVGERQGAPVSLARRRMHTLGSAAGGGGGAAMRRSASLSGCCSG
ncbi:Ras-related protein Rab-32 [Trypanosoma grayi]|uniref:Ras-related protein Rab-32 n=1 Tax=Trypanosoma grayi TaxID=71804 RepID=UPI0004F3FA03|nr:Ras-related protein Rab-32 [Trypanosoma grayi]KEG09774.1 Ras-related protein Rab-32 [Trypanosoma grayi]